MSRPCWYRRHSTLMTTPEVQVANETGPFLQAAAICERVIQEQDGAVSLIRIIDRIYFLADPDGRPITPRQQVWFFIGLKAGTARGRHTLTVMREQPSGLSAQVLQAPVLFEGEERGANLVVQAMFEPDEEGLYWYDVLLGDVRLTRMPLRAVFQPLPTAGSGTG